MRPIASILFPVLYLTLIEVGFGMALVLCFIPRKALGPGFGKTISPFIFFSLLIPLIALVPRNWSGDWLVLKLSGWAAVVLWFAYFVVLNYPKELSASLLSLAATLCTGIMIATTSRILASYFHSPQGLDGFGPSVPMPTACLFLGMTSSALCLGTVTMAMLIGHWYLVIAGLPLHWLKNSCLAFGAALVFKLISIMMSLTLGAATDPFGTSGFLDKYVFGNITLFALRVLVGIIIPAALCVMAYRATDDSTQSATGILFPAMIPVLIGEITGTFLTLGLFGIHV